MILLSQPSNYKINQISTRLKREEKRLAERRRKQRILSRFPDI